MTAPEAGKTTSPLPPSSHFSNPLPHPYRFLCVSSEETLVFSSLLLSCVLLFFFLCPFLLSPSPLSPPQAFSPLPSADSPSCLLGTDSGGSPRLRWMRCQPNVYPTASSQSSTIGQNPTSLSYSTRSGEIYTPYPFA